MSHPINNPTTDLPPLEVGEVWENPVTGKRGKLAEAPWHNSEGRLVAELTALVGARVVGEHRHPSLVERFTVLQGDLLQLTVFGREFSDVIQFRSPPPLVQKAMGGVLGLIAPPLGYRGTYPELSRTVLAPRPATPQI